MWIELIYIGEKIDQKSNAKNVLKWIGIIAQTFDYKMEWSINRDIEEPILMEKI